MRLSRSLRPLRLLRYWGSHSECKVYAGFSLLFEAKVAVEVIVASDVIISVEIIKATEVFRAP